MSTIPEEWLQDDQEDKSKDHSGISCMLVEDGQERDETIIHNKSNSSNREEEIDYLIENGQERDESFTNQKQSTSFVKEKKDESFLKDKNKKEESFRREAPTPAQKPAQTPKAPSKNSSFTEQKSLNSSSSRWFQKKPSTYSKPERQQKPFSKRPAYDNSIISSSMLQDEDEPTMQFAVSFCIDRTRISLMHAAPLKQATHDDIVVLPFQSDNFNDYFMPSLAKIDKINIKNYILLEKQNKNNEKITWLLMNCPSKNHKAFGLVNIEHLAAGLKGLLQGIFRLQINFKSTYIIVPYLWSEPSTERSLLLVLTIYEYIQSCEYCQTHIKICVQHINAFQHCQEFMYGKILEMGPGSRKNRS